MGLCVSVGSKSPLQDGWNSIGSSAEMPKTRRTEVQILQSPNLKIFSFNALKTATGNFHPDSKLGEGGFGCVFKGRINESGTGIDIAVKKLNDRSQQGHKEWLVEINYLGRLDNPNLVKLIGYCLEDNNRLLAYEFMPEGSLEDCLFRRDAELRWSVRMKIALGAAKGLAFLHSDEVKIIHRDFKSSNILLDKDFNAKLSDFGLAKDGPTGDRSHVTTRVIGTHGYTAPEYIKSGHLTIKSDVYSFGVVLLEMLTGKRAIDRNRPSGQHNLVKWAKPFLIWEENWGKCFLTSKGKILNVLDAGMNGQYESKDALKAAKLAAQCLSAKPRSRPSMDEVVGILKQLLDSSQNETSEAAITSN